MTTPFLWQAYQAASASLLTTQLDSLASASITAAGTAVDNTSNLYQLMDVDFVTGGTLTTTGNPIVEVWLLLALNGSNYEDGSSSIAPQRPPDFVLPVRVGTTITPRSAIKRVIMPQGLWKPLARVTLGNTLPASGNTLNYRPYNHAY